MALLQQVIHVEKLEQENNRVPASTFLNIDGSWFLEKGTLEIGSKKKVTRNRLLEIGCEKLVLRKGYFRNRKKRVPRNRF